MAVSDIFHVWDKGEKKVKEGPGVVNPAITSTKLNLMVTTSVDTRNIKGIVLCYRTEYCNFK